MNHIRVPMVAIAAALISAGCAATPPSQELVDARTAYEAAARGPARTLEQDRLLSAKQALDQAEAAHAEDAQSAEERHLAYVAERVALLADTFGRVAVNQRDAAASKAETQRLAEARRRSAEGQVVTNREQLDAERTARMKAEAGLQAAMKSLSDIASLREDPRGLILTLNGSVLFASGQSALLPAAQTRLLDVAKALSDLEPGQTIVVEGHTDSQGTDESNLILSQARAEAVRDHLVRSGFAAERITAAGRGESSPVADNATAEGRANNRRVEIVIARPRGPTASR